MKKADAKQRRRTTKHPSLFSKFDTGADDSKDTLQIVSEKLVSEPNSAWYGSELLYIIRTLRRAKKGARQDADKLNTQGSSQPDRYLAMLRKRDANQTINVIRVNLKENEIETKNNFDLKILRSIDCGSEDNEMLLSFDNADHNLFFSTQTERDETLWIIVQICKHVIHSEINVGYSVDIDALTYITNTNGTLSRFPILQKMLQSHTKELGDHFSNEEAEAESLLDELQWGSSLQGHTGLSQTLSIQSDKISDEIIDFLLQWEEMDNCDAEANDNNNNHAQSHPTVTVHSSSSSSSSSNHHKNVPGGGGMQAKMSTMSMMSAAAAGSVSDTSEVLTALGQVDVELAAVDHWLGEQIGRLEEIQSNLHMIEDESGALESSWQSLRSVQEVVTHLVDRYSISDEDESLLKDPNSILNPILKSATLHRTEILLNPLLEAMTKVRDALKLKFDDVADITTAQWRQLQNMTSISSQKGKLLDIVDSCCDSLSSTVLDLCDWLVKHKALTEQGATLKTFNFSPIIAEQGEIGLDSVTSGEPSLTQVPEWYLNIRSPEKNQLIHAKCLFEDNFKAFLPLLDLLTELTPTISKPLQDSYARTISDGLYRPLFRVFRHDLLNMINFKQTVVTLANCAAHKARAKPPPPPAVSFLYGSGAKEKAATALTPWLAFKVSLMTIIPLLEREEDYLKSILRLGGSSRMTENAVFDKAHTLMEEIFDYMLNKLEAVLTVKPMTAPEGSSVGGIGDKSGGSSAAATSVTVGAGAGSSSSGAPADGISALGLLTVLTEFETAYRDAMILQLSEVINAALTASAGIDAQDSTVAGVRANIMALQSKQMQQHQEQHQHENAHARHHNHHHHRHHHHHHHHHASPPVDEEIMLIPDEATIRAEALSQYSHLYLARAIEGMRQSLLQRINQFTNEQVNWLKSQRGDPKIPEVLQPFASFPTMILQLQEMSHELEFECVNDMLRRLAMELFHWLTIVSSQNDKYNDKIKITNYGYFVMAIEPMKLPILENFVSNARQQHHESTVRYVNWMVSYEFPQLAALAVRLDGLGKRVNEEELSLYIRRKDVLNVVKELELKSLESMVHTLRKRLEKHFRSEYDTELHLVERTWKHLEDRILGILSRLEEAASLSYQIKLEVGPKMVQQLFAKFVGHKTNTEP